MSNTNPDRTLDPTVPPRAQVSVSGDAQSSEGLQRLLDRVADQLSTVESRNTAALRQMEERLDRLATANAAPAEGGTHHLARIAESIELVARRIAEARGEGVSDFSRPGALASNSAPPLPLRYSGSVTLPAWRRIEPSCNARGSVVVDPFDFAESDTSSARTGEAALREHADQEQLPRLQGTSWHSDCAGAVEAREGSNPPLAPQTIERAWFEERLAEVGARIEQSLAEMRPDATFMALGQRLEELEHRVSSTLEHVARRSDLESLRQVETHVSQLSGQLHDARAQLARLSAIESHLQAVAGRFSEECVAGLEQAARAHLGNADATHTGEQRAADAQAQTAAKLDQLHEMLARFDRERRQVEGRTQAALETMQQALVRVLDRVDALESGLRERSGPEAPVPWPAPQAPDLPAPAGEAGRRAPAPVGATGVGVERSPPEAAGPPAAPAPASRDVQRSLERVRQELVADAKRARQRAAGQEWEGAKAGRRPKSRKPGLSLVAALGRLSQSQIFGRTSGRVLFAFLFLLMVMLAASMVLGRRATGADPPSAPASGEHSSKGPSAARPPAPGDGDTVSFSLPHGVLLHHSPVPAAREELERASREQRMADASARLGMTVAKTAPAALTPDPVEAGEPEVAVSGDAQGRTPLELPPATVGPLSLRLAAANGDPSAEFEVAARLAEGRGTDQNLKDAVHWYQRSASKGSAMAQYRLATFFERGLGVKADPARARIWYRRAAEQGNVKAMHNLAVLSADRESASPDYETAVQWFTKAAEHGLADSQYNLAVLYENGLGVKKDPILAYTWFAIAAQSGDKDAGRRRDEARGRLDPKEVASADEAVRLFTPRPVDPLANEPIMAGQAWKLRQNLRTGG